MYLNIVSIRMTKKQGEKLKIGEVKTAIVSYILENKESVSEPDIRKHLKTALEVQHQGTINNHLHKLADLKCIESVNPTRKDRSNYWDITKLIHLKNIRHEFPDLKINTYEKSIMIIFKERGYSLKEIENLDFYIKLRLSVSLFDAFLDSDINELLTISKNIFLKGKWYTIEDEIKKCKEQFYEIYLKVNPDLKPEDDFPTDYKNVSEEDFIKIYEGKYPGITNEMRPMIKNIFATYKDLNIKLKYESVKILLEHFINHDIFKGLEPEREYFKELDECSVKALNILIKEGTPHNTDRLIELTHLEHLKVYREFIKIYKQPSMFYISENSETIYNMLKDFYKEQL